MPISAAQCRAARGLIGWSQGYLAQIACVGRNTVVDFEKERRIPRHNNLIAMRKVLEAAGVVFIDANGGGPGVRLRDNYDET
jgi:transcriptional regulator with XRE-family HTH domain